MILQCIVSIEELLGGVPDRSFSLIVSDKQTIKNIKNQ